MADKNQPQQQEKSQVPQPAEPLVQGAEKAPPAGSAAAAALQRVKAAPPAGADPDDVLTLQRAMGNRAVRGILAREGVEAAVGETIGTLQRGILGQVMREDGEDGGGGATAEAAADPEQQALQDFLDRGMMPDADGENIIGSAGMGGFNAKFDPDERKLIVTVKVGINFHHGLFIDPTLGLVIPDASGFTADDADALAGMWTQAANVTSAFPNIPDRVNEVNTNWRWANDEKDGWMIRYENAVRDVWDNRHFFQSRRWEELQSNVQVVLDVHEGAHEGDHCSARIIKTPPGGMDTAYVAAGSETSATDQELFMSSSGTGPNPANFLRYSLQFADGSASVWRARGTVHSTDRGPRYLRKFIADFQEGRRGQGVPIQVIGRASASGDAERNRRLSERRAANVANFLQANGLRGAVRRVSHVGTGSEGATEDAEWRRVDIVVGSGEAQNTAAHEFGHMIGLGDEYSSPRGGFYPGAGTPVNIGSPATHNAMAQAMGGGVQGAVGENTDSIMSVGNTVRPQHYATFHHALEEVTGEDWEYGGASPGRVRTLPATGGPEPTTAVA
jgi:hypothetical protein